MCNVNILADSSNDNVSDDSNYGWDSSDRKNTAFGARVRAATAIQAMKYSTPDKKDKEQNMQ